MTLVVHALVLINIDSNMHGDEIKIAYLNVPIILLGLCDH